MREPASIDQQAEHVEDLISRCVMRNGEVAQETWLRLEPEDVDALDKLAMRLRRMAPHEGEIKRLVTGR